MQSLVSHIRLLNKRLTDRNLNNEIVNIVVTVQSLINVTVKISVNKIRKVVSAVRGLLLLF